MSDMVPPPGAPSPPESYRCAMCGGQFLKTVSDEQAHAEAEEIFGKYPAEEEELVCDDCWKSFDITICDVMANRKK